MKCRFSAVIDTELGSYEVEVNNLRDPGVGLGYAELRHALYAVLALWVPGIWLIAVLEERELRERFGAAYDAYCRRVPRFLPQLRNARTG